MNTGELDLLTLVIRAGAWEAVRQVSATESVALTRERCEEVEADIRAQVVAAIPADVVAALSARKVFP